MEENKDQIGQTPQVPPDDITTQSFQDVITQAAVLDEKEEEEVEAEETPKEEEKPEEKPVEPVEVKEETPAPPPPPVIDEEKLTNNIVEKVLEAQKQTNTTQEQDELTTALKDAEMRAKAEGREITYVEALKIVNDVSKKQVKEEIMSELQAEADEEERVQKEQEEAVRVQQETVTKQWNEYWDTQFSELEADGKIPAGEEGKKVRVELLEAMHKVAQERQAEGKQPILNIKEIFAFHYTPKEDKTVTKKNAPVFGNEKNVSKTPNMPTTEQLRNMDFRDVFSVASEIDNS